jgi:hypothetical protein
LEARDALEDARRAISIEDVKRMRTEESSFVSSMKSAQHALAIAFAAGPPAGADALKAELKGLSAAWDREIGPYLTNTR